MDREEEGYAASSRFSCTVEYDVPVQSHDTVTCGSRDVERVQFITPPL